MSQKNLIFQALILAIFIGNTLLAQSITMSEVMFDPLGSEYYDEFIELHNCGDSAVSLQGWRLIVNGVADFLEHLEVTDSLLPGHFGLILDRGYLIEAKSTAYEHLVPDTVIRLTIKDNSFGANGLSNSTANLILLVSATGDTLSQVQTKPGQPAGYTLEKIQLCQPDNPNNWAMGSAINGTPGFSNSCAPRDYDLAVSSFQARQTIVPSGQSVLLDLVVKNVGLQAIPDFEILLGEDHNDDQNFQVGEIIWQTAQSLFSGDSLSFHIPASISSSGKHTFMVELLYLPDENPDNNRGNLTIASPYPARSLIINEFMYCPAAGQNEWVELYNISEDTINLKGWTLKDNTTPALLTAENYLVPPGAIVVVASDSNFLKYWEKPDWFIACASPLPTLNNTSDSIIIRDYCETTIDALCYSSSWGYRTGYALERRNPYANGNIANNWGLSVTAAGGTPGQTNSIALPQHDGVLDSVVFIAPSSHLIQGQSLTVRSFVRNGGLLPIEQFTLHIAAYRPGNPADFLADTCFTVQALLATGDSQSVDFRLAECPGGIWQVIVVLTMAGDGLSINNRQEKLLRVGYPPGTLIVNEIMYAPQSGAPEWFEVFNRTASCVDLNGWRFRDATGSWLILCDTTRLCPPGSYFIVAANYSFLDNHPELEGAVGVPPVFPTLNNTADSLSLRDAGGNLDEAVCYKAIWGGATGISLERRNPFQPALNADHWATCRHTSGSTPGSLNSVAIRQQDLALISVSLDSSDLPLQKGSQTILVFAVRNIGLQTVTNFAITVNVKRHAQLYTVTLCDTTINASQPLLPEEEFRVEIPLCFTQGGVFNLSVTVDCAWDERHDDNTFSAQIPVGFPAQAMIVNEIMYAPRPGEPEWFELFNTTPDTVDLNLWSLRDALGAWKPLTDSTVLVAPGAFVVITASQNLSLDYPDFHGLLLVPPVFPNLNNSSDSLMVCDATGGLMDGIYYRSDWGSAPGISLERRNPFLPAVSASNWGPSRASWGASPGTANSILKYQFDLAIVDTSFQFASDARNVEEWIEFNLQIINTGREPASGFQVYLFQDSDHDSCADWNELVWQTDCFAALAPDSLLHCSGKIQGQITGLSTWLAVVHWSDDQNPVNNSARTNLKVAYPSHCVVINEFLPYPTGGQSEFIEIFNQHDQPVNLEQWSLSNKRTAATLGAKDLPPQTYLVLCRDSTIFDFVDASRVRVVLISNWPGMNNTADQIILRDLTGLTLDSLTYDVQWAPKSGLSFEKKHPGLPSSSRSSWDYCQAKWGMTPGVHNSVLTPEYDLALDSLHIFPASGDTSTIFHATLYLSNCGRQVCPTAVCRLVLNNFLSTQELTTLHIPQILPGESHNLQYVLPPLPSGTYWVTACLEWSNDINTGNDTLRVPLAVAYPTGTILISEFMAQPLELDTPTNSNAEYVELYLAGNTAIDVEGWALADANTSRWIKIIGRKIISPGQYCVLASDSTIFRFPDVNQTNTVVLPHFPSLGNTEDALYLFDPTGHCSDSLQYLSTWTITPGHALERINLHNANTATNWRTCVAPAGGTPGTVNSVAFRTPLAKTGLQADPAIFSPNGDGRDEELALRYCLPFPSAYLTMEIYDLLGRRIARPARRLITGSDGQVYWDGIGDLGGKARIGTYIARCVACDLNSTKSVEYITTFVLVR